MEENGYRYALVLRRADGTGQARVLAESGRMPSPYGGGFLRWSPVRPELAFRLPGGEVELYQVQTQVRRKLPVPEGAKRLFSVGSGGVAWSPDGTRVAFTAPDPDASATAANVGEGNAGVELTEYWDPVRAAGTPEALRSFPHQPSLLWVMTLADGKVKQLTDASLDALAYSWAPDGRRLAVSAGNDFRNTRSGLGTDLYLVDAASADIRPLFSQRGGAAQATWSPDGQWIAFASQLPFTTDSARYNLRHNHSLFVVPAEGGQAMDLLAVARDQPWLPVNVRNLAWSADSRQVYFEGGAQLRLGYYRAGITGRDVAPETPRDTLAMYQSCDLGATGALACVRETATTTAELVLRDAGAKAWRVLDAPGGDRIFAGLTSEVVEWRSGDDRWDVRGILIKPPGFDSSRRYPLMVYVNGGPSMVRAEFGVTSQYPLLAWARRGFLVLAPNTRGRSGYGPAFDAAIADERSQLENPHLDILSGVDALVARGMADPERLGITGFSYGFGLGLETITRSPRFRAASLGDGVVEMLTTAFTQAAMPWYPDLMRDLAGFESPRTPNAVDALLSGSPLMRLDQVRTPVLAEFGGIHGIAATQGRMLLHGLRLHEVPVELIAYPRTGHGIVEPQLRMDSMRRNVEWFDHWVLGRSTARMRARYGPAEAGD